MPLRTLAASREPLLGPGRAATPSQLLPTPVSLSGDQTSKREARRGAQAGVRRPSAALPRPATDLPVEPLAAAPSPSRLTGILRATSGSRNRASDRVSSASSPRTRWGRDGGSLLTSGGDDQVIFDGGNRRTAIRNEWTNRFPTPLVAITTNGYWTRWSAVIVGPSGKSRADDLERQPIRIVHSEPSTKASASPNFSAYPDSHRANPRVRTLAQSRLGRRRSR
jgi:hypothetical protein